MCGHCATAARRNTRRSPLCHDEAQSCYPHVLWSSRRQYPLTFCLPLLTLDLLPVCMAADPVSNQCCASAFHQPFLVSSKDRDWPLISNFKRVEQRLVLCRVCSTSPDRLVQSLSTPCSTIQVGSSLGFPQSSLRPRAFSQSPKGICLYTECDSLGIYWLLSSIIVVLLSLDAR